MQYILDVVPVLIIVIFVYFGKIDGFLKSLIELVGYAATIVVSFSASEIIANRIYSDLLKTAIEKSLQENNIPFLTGDVVDTVFKPASVSIVKLIVMVLLLLILFFIVRLLSRVLGKLLDKSFLNVPNKLLGAVLGAVKGAAVVLLLVGVIVLIMPVVSKDVEIFSPSTIEKTYVFKYLYNFVNTLI